MKITHKRPFIIGAVLLIFLVVSTGTFLALRQFAAPQASVAEPTPTVNDGPLPGEEYVEMVTGENSTETPIVRVAE